MSRGPQGSWEDPLIVINIIMNNMCISVSTTASVSQMQFICVHFHFSWVPRKWNLKQIITSSMCNIDSSVPKNTRLVSGGGVVHLTNRWPWTMLQYELILSAVFSATMNPPSLQNASFQMHVHLNHLLAAVWMDGWPVCHSKSSAGVGRYAAN